MNRMGGDGKEEKVKDEKRGEGMVYRAGRLYSNPSSPPPSSSFAHFYHFTHATAGAVVPGTP